MGGASTLERRWLAGAFSELCRIPSPSLSERACADHVIGELAAIGVPVLEDRAAEQLGGDCGNLLARIEGEPGAGPRSTVMLCAHLDTVPLAAAVEPVLLDGVWENANEGILGADNKAAVAVLLALARRIKGERSRVDVELLFTVAEEISLAGSRVFDTSVLRSDFGYVFDHATPIGEVVMGSPTHFRLRAEFRGAAAHAGIRPQDGRSAILAASRAIAELQHGRLDERSTLNIGTITGGSAINIVPDRCTITGEVRSLDDDRAQQLAEQFVDAVQEASNRPDCDCDVDITVERTFSGYQLSGAEDAVQVANAALRTCGFEPTPILSGGGSDANSLRLAGMRTVNLANGTERAHEPGESVSSAALEQMLDVSIALLDHAARRVHAPGV